MTLVTNKLLASYAEVIHLTFPVVKKELLQLVLERMKGALMHVEEFEPYYEKLKSFEPSAHIPDRVSLLEDTDYDTEYRSMKEYLNRPHFTFVDTKEKYSSGRKTKYSSEIDSKETLGATFFVNMATRRMRVILLRKPLNLSVLVHELLHIFEEYLNLQFGELARFEKTIADHLNIALPNADP